MYPCWRYKVGDARIIFDLEQEQRLGGKWFSTPTELAQSLIAEIPALEAVSESPPQPKVKKGIKKK